MNGILLVDKPQGVTSHDVVDHIRRAAGTRRVGHTGTLDPAATGLLILCLGVGTRLSEFLTGLDKVYEGSMLLGVTTDSYDLDGSVLEERPVPALAEGEIRALFERYTGSIMQTPPMVSAVKVGGERLYKKARKGEEVERAPRPITIHEFELLALEPPRVRFRIRCSRGTYARSLCHDIGQALGCGAALASLRRTWVGPHSVDEAKPMDFFKTPEDVLEQVRPLENALDLPQVVLEAAAERALTSGACIGLAQLRGGCPVDQGWVQVKGRAGRLLALAEVTTGPLGLTLQPRRVLRG